MNRRQQTVLIATLVIVVIMLLFPPWYHQGQAGGREINYYHGYHYISSPPHKFTRIDIAALLWPVGAVCLMAFLAYLELQDKR